MPARTQIPITTLDRLGKSPPSAVQGDDIVKMYFANNHGETLIEINNRHASFSGRVGFELFNPDDVDNAMVENRITDAIPPGGTIMVGPYPTQLYSRTNFDVFVNPVPGSAHSLWFRGYELENL